MQVSVECNNDFPVADLLSIEKSFENFTIVYLNGIYGKSGTFKLFLETYWPMKGDLVVITAVSR